MPATPLGQKKKQARDSLNWEGAPPTQGRDDNPRKHGQKNGWFIKRRARPRTMPKLQLRLTDTRNKADFFFF